MINKILTASLLLFALAANAQDTNKKTTDQRTNREVMINTCDRAHLTSFSEFKESYDTGYLNYAVNDTVLTSLKPLLAEKKITIVLGTWCGDSKLQVPHFYKILDAAGFPEKSVKIICVDGDKKAENGLIDGLDIKNVPTFIIYKDQQELGRIIESPKETLEKDLLVILKK